MTGLMPQPDPKSDEGVIFYAPAGWLYTLVIASHAKRVAQGCPMSAPERLKLLERIERLPGGGVTAAAIAVVEPCCDTAVEMIREAKHNLDALAAIAVFTEFSRLNPSLLTALRLCGHSYERSTLP